MGGKLSAKKEALKRYYAEAYKDNDDKLTLGIVIGNISKMDRGQIRKLYNELIGKKKRK